MTELRVAIGCIGAADWSSEFVDEDVVALPQIGDLFFFWGHSLVGEQLVRGRDVPRRRGHVFEFWLGRRAAESGRNNCGDASLDDGEEQLDRFKAAAFVDSVHGGGVLGHDGEKCLKKEGLGKLPLVSVG